MDLENKKNHYKGTTLVTDVLIYIFMHVNEFQMALASCWEENSQYVRANRGQN